MISGFQLHIIAAPGSAGFDIRCGFVSSTGAKQSDHAGSQGIGFSGHVCVCMWL